METALYTLPPEIEAIRRAVARLCEDFPAAYWRDADAARAYPSAFVAALTKGGYLAALIPTEYGGSGLPLVAAAAILQQVQESGGNGAACHAQMYMLGAILRHGSAEQKARYLPAIASGALRFQAFGVTEPGSGTDTAAIRTRATRTGSGWRIRGQKIWTSRAEHSDLMLLLARTSDPAPGGKRHDGLSAFLVDLREALHRGLTIRPIRTMMNHATTEVFLDDVEVPEDALLGAEGQGFRCILTGMNAERILIGAECVGDARWFIAKAAAYARERVVFGRAIGQNQGVAFPLARCFAETESARVVVYRAAGVYDAGAPCGAEANLAKLMASEASWHAADMCVQTHGGFGFAEEYDVERKFRETRLYRVAPVSTNLVLAYFAEHCLDLPRSY
ncbi:MAG: acyl-CoA/acyl-ACP dehydrogenase [Burkholderiales bacterium]|nr:acyl-CoA/acyl-ACP dehydrogenase [Burkholderiales bacterium]